jgi:hypothetical protein
MLVLSVLSGEKPVTTAIEEVQISRGFYYQLETKALNAMLLALAPGGDGDPSPDAAGLTARIQQLEAKLAKAEAAQRRAERLLFLQRKLAPGPIKTHRGRPPKTTTSSTPGGRRSWRSSMTTKPTSSPRRTRSTPRTQRPTTNKPASTTPPAAAASIPTPGGASGAPNDGSENSRAPTLRSTT